MATACSGIAVSPTKTSMHSCAYNASVNLPPWSLCLGMQAYYALKPLDLPHPALIRAVQALHTCTMPGQLGALVRNGAISC